MVVNGAQQHVYLSSSRSRVVVWASCVLFVSQSEKTPQLAAALGFLVRVGVLCRIIVWEAPGPLLLFLCCARPCRAALCNHLRVGLLCRIVDGGHPEPIFSAA